MEIHQVVYHSVFETTSSGTPPYSHLISTANLLKLWPHYFVPAKRPYIFLKENPLKADLHGTTLSHAINLRQVYDMNRFV